MPLDRLVAGVRAELDALLPVLAEEVAAAVALRHGVAGHLDVAPVLAALRGLRSLDDPSVERAVLGALGHPIGGTAMPPEPKRPEETKEHGEKPADAPAGKPAEAPWYEECSPEVEPLADFAVDTADDVSALVKGALQIDLGRLYAETVVAAATRIKSGRFDPEFARCAEKDRVEIARRSLCAEDEARTYVATKADPVALHVLSRGQRTAKEAAWRNAVRLIAVADATGRDGDWRRAGAAALIAQRTIAFHTTLYHWFLVHDGLDSLARLRETVELIGDPIEVIAAYTGRDPSDVYDRFARYEAIVEVLGYVASGGTERERIAKAGYLFGHKSHELAHGA